MGRGEWCAALPRGRSQRCKGMRAGWLRHSLFHHPPTHQASFITRPSTAHPPLPTCTVHIWRKSRSASCHCPPRSRALTREQQVTTSASMRLACSREGGGRNGGREGGAGWVHNSRRPAGLRGDGGGRPCPASSPVPPRSHLHVLKDLEGCVPLLALGQRGDGGAVGDGVTGHALAPHQLENLKGLRQQSMGGRTGG